MSKQEQNTPRLAKKVHEAIYGKDFGLTTPTPLEAVAGVLAILDKEKLRITNSWRKKVGLPPKVMEEKLPPLGEKVGYIPKKKYNDIEAPIKKKKENNNPRGRK